MVRLETSAGPILLELYPETAPKTVANFVAYVREGFYDGTIFHRVINNFMVQGGGFLPGMEQKVARPPIKNEADNRVRNERGTIAMARARHPDSASSQFFINVADNDFLNFSSPTDDGWGYCVFGRVVEGMEVVDRIKGAPTTKRGVHENVPITDIVIKKAEIIE